MKHLLLLLFSVIQFSLLAQTTIFPTGSSWKYNDSGTDLGTSWSSSSYNDATWSSGNAILGYGTINAGTISTTLSYGSNSNNKYPTTYFRKTFNYSTTGNETYYKISALIDDGAVIYINGTEVQRVNMPSGTISYNTWASGVGDEDNYNSFTIPASSIQNGSNTIAVEVHQRSGSSSDIGLDLSLTAHFDLNIRFIHFGSTGNPLNGLRVTWRDDTGNDSIKWGYTTAYSNGKHKAVSRELYSDSLFEYSFPVLNASSTIHYSIYSKTFDVWSQDMTYKTSVDTSSTHFKFVAFGDCRTNLNDWETVSDMVPDADFTLFTGDIIVDGGNTSDWDNWFEYGNDFISSHIIYHTFGNHEDQGSGPNIYDNLYVLPENPSGSEKYYSLTFGNAVFICLNSEDPGNTTQYNWLLQTLSDNSDKTWKIVWFHKPFYTSPSHVGDMDSYWNTWWKAFDDYGVDIIFNGHTHNYQRTKPINRNVSTTAAVDYYGSCPQSGRCQIVTGRAGAPGVGAGSGWFIQTTSPNINYGMTEINGNTLTFIARDTSNTLLDSFQLVKNLDITMSSTPEGPPGAGNGSATANPSGGHSPYTYLWNTTETTATISNLDSGWYYVTITDDVECELYDSIHVDTIHTPQYVITDAATNITTNAATLNSTIKPPSGGVVFGIEFELGTNTTYGTTVSSSPNWANSNSTTTGNATSLSPATTYHYRVKGTDGSTTYYGSDTSFTTLTPFPPTVNIGSDFYNISANAAENSANEVVSDGGSPITERGIVYGETSNPTWKDSKKTSSGTTGVFDIALLNLDASTTYYARAYAINNVDTTYSSLEKKFTTEPQIQASIDSITIDNNYPDYINVYFTNGNGAGTMLIIKENSDITRYPSDGVSEDTYYYDANYGNGYDLGDGNYVAFNGSHSKGDITIGNIDNTQDYFFAVVEYSGTGSETNYRTGDAGKANTLGTSLPIELIDFNVENQDSFINIHWVTASEINNEWFEIQKSIDGKEFYNIKKLKGAGNSNQRLEYNVKDYQLINGISYYRLKQTDYDGKYTYSNIKVIYIKNSIDLSISNITTNANKIDFSYNSSIEQNSKIQLIDMTGKIVNNLQISGVGSQKVTIPMNNMSHGIYLIRLTSSTKSISYKVRY